MKATAPNHVLGGVLGGLMALPYLGIAAAIAIKTARDVETIAVFFGAIGIAIAISAIGTARRSRRAQATAAVIHLGLALGLVVGCVTFRTAHLLFIPAILHAATAITCALATVKRRAA